MIFMSKLLLNKWDEVVRMDLSGSIEGKVAGWV
jgi:hypothetical protein